MSGDLHVQDLWVGGTDTGAGVYHTYRIPALVVTTPGTLVAICEGRKHTHHDVGVIDLLVRRSEDGGRTWSDTAVIATEDGQTCGNPAPIVDRHTGTIWLPFCKNPAFEDRESRGNKWRYDRPVWLTHSADDGRTWAEAVEITAQVKDPSWTWYSTGPVHGIQLSSGRLVASCTHRVRGSGGPEEEDRARYSHVIYSDDHGANWRVGGSVPQEGTNECAAVETADGALYLTCRDQGRGGRRYAAWSHDGGEAFSEVYPEETLIEPRCEASIVRFTDARRHDRGRILFSNPASRSRDTLTVRMSEDECRTWPAAKVLEPGISAYSDLAVMEDLTVACLYERGETSPYERLTLARFDLEWLTG
jgi:sialidase-1